jgi:drug/metabolite transporter (DMT)-like permease
MKEKYFIYLLIFSMLLWGGGWSALKVLTYDLPLEIIIFWRFFIMSLAFIPILFFVKDTLTINKTNLTYIAGSSILNIAFMVSSFLGVKYGLAGSGGVIITVLSPVMTFLLTAILFRKRLHNKQYFGLFLGVIGGVIMLELTNISDFFHSANIFYLLCAVIWAGVTVLAQYSHKHIHPIHYTFLISLTATIVTFIYALDKDLLSVFNQSKKFWIALIYIGVLAQSLATTIFFMASGKIGSEKTSSFMFLVPIFALLVAWIVLDEPIQVHIVIGGFISLIAVYFINKKL